MNSIISILAILAMLVTSMGGLTAKLETPVSVEMSIQADGEALLQMAGADTATPEAAQTYTLITDVLNVLKLRGVADKNTIELDLLAEDDPLITIGARGDENGGTIASTLLGSKVFFVSQEIINMYKEAILTSLKEALGKQGSNGTDLFEAFKSLDFQKITADLGEIGQKFMASFQEKIGTPEKGEFAVDGFSFTTKVPVNMTYEELMILMLNSTKEFLTKDYAVEFLNKIGVKEDMGAKVDEAIEKVKNTPEEEKIDMTLAAYMNDDGSTYVSVDLKGKTETALGMTKEGGEAATEKRDMEMHVGAGQVDGLTRIIITSKSGEETNFIFNVTGGAENAEITGNITGKGTKMDVNAVINKYGMDMVITAEGGALAMPMKYHVSARKEGEKMVETVELFFNNMEKALLTYNITAGKGGEFLSKFEGEGIETVPVEKLSGENSTEVQSLQMTMFSSLLQGVNTLKDHLPENSADMLLQMVQSMMAGGKQ